MARSSYVFTSESVSEGHPDKVADRISDTVVDAFLSADPEARVACETMVTTNRIILAGEVRAGKPGNDKAANKAFTQEIIAGLQPKVRAAVKDIGYAQKASTGRRPSTPAICTASRHTSRKASMRRARRTRVPATRASCSATPAKKRRS